MSNEEQREEERAASSSAPGAHRTVTIVNSRGLHARAAAKFVKLAEGFDAQVSVTREGETVPGGSIMGLMMLAAAAGCEIRIEAIGSDAKVAVDALAELVAAGFEED